jgi:hypothetical protein
MSNYSKMTDPRKKEKHGQLGEKMYVCKTHRRS